MVCKKETPHIDIHNPAVQEACAAILRENERGDSEESKRIAKMIAAAAVKQFDRALLWSGIVVALLCSWLLCTVSSATDSQ